MRVCHDDRMTDPPGAAHLAPSLAVPLVRPARPAPLVLRDQAFDAARPAVMAIVNRTPDSFWSGNRHASMDGALRALDEAVDAGADLVDVGGVRAGSEGEVVTAEQEIERVLPFLQRVRAAYPQLPLSLDTWRAEVAQAASGLVDLVNDTWAGYDPHLLEVAVATGAGYVVSHTGGRVPRTDPVDVTYGPDQLDVVRDVVATLAAGAARAVAAGMPRERVLVDPTLDFGKTTAHSLRVLRHTEAVVGLGFPVLQALSRKDFIGETLDLVADERLEGSLAATAVAAWLGATVFRTHDVRATRRALDMVASIRGDRPPARSERGIGPSSRAVDGRREVRSPGSPGRRHTHR